MIEVKDLHKSYGKLNVLQGITETIQDQEVVCVIGPSGSGKSTFLRWKRQLPVLSPSMVWKLPILKMM